MNEDQRDDHRKEGKPSFIGEARREQIIKAAIETLDEIGYVKASLAQIAKKAGISTALISYHFSDKHDLMNHLLTNLLEDSTSYVLERVHRETTYHGKLEAFIMASLAYQAANPARNTALIEIVFNARTPDRTPYYKLSDDDEEDPVRDELRSILQEGQAAGEFGVFPADALANMIQGAIGEYMFNTVTTAKTDAATYGRELVKIIRHVLKGINE